MLENKVPAVLCFQVKLKRYTIDFERQQMIGRRAGPKNAKEGIKIIPSLLILYLRN
jgi:hypothetical protein